MNLANTSSCGLPPLGLALAWLPATALADALAPEAAVSQYAARPKTPWSRARVLLGPPGLRGGSRSGVCVFPQLPPKRNDIMVRLELA